MNNARTMAFLAASALGAALLISATRSPAEQAQHKKAHPDEVAIRAACMDYIHAFYKTKPELLERSVSKELVKFGYYRAEGSSEYRAMPMSFEQAKSLAASWNAKGWLPEDAPASVAILDRLDKTAAAKVTAYWGIDYVHLEKVDGRWKFRHVLWQSKPATGEKPAKEAEEANAKRRG